MRTKHRLLICTVALGTIPIALSGCGSGSNSPIPSSIGAAPFRELALGPYRTLYKFRKTGRDGSDPNGQLTALNGVLYGTTYSGGPGDGTVFSLTTSGEERVLYGFKGGSNGDNPNAGLVAVNGVLYGTTVTGGGGCPQQEGCGTVFAVTTSGQQRVIYHFKGGRDGSSPAGGLTLLGGRLYGTTSLGGSSQGCVSQSLGRAVERSFQSTLRDMRRYCIVSAGRVTASHLRPAPGTQWEAVRDDHVGRHGRQLRL